MTEFDELASALPGLSGEKESGPGIREWDLDQKNAVSRNPGIK